MSRTWIVENKWSCNACSTSNRGRDLRCSKCGKPKEANQEYDLSGSTTAPEVTDPNQLKVAKGGANWSCTYCGSDARNIHGECYYCGGPKTTVAKAVKPVTKVAKKAVAPIKRTAYAAYDTVQNATSFSEHQKKNNRRNATVAMVVAGVMLFGMLMYAIFGKHTQHVKVTYTHWAQTTTVQQRYTKHTEDWIRDREPSHFNDVCETRQHGTHSCNPYRCNAHNESYSCNPRSVPSGTTCTSNGNGYSTCRQTYRTEYSTCYRTVYDTCYHQCPTYDEWCSYDYYHWGNIRTATNSGTNHDLSYPTLEFHETEEGPQRLVHTENYMVKFKNDDDTYEYSPNSENDYNRFVVGHRWLIETNLMGSVDPTQEERN